MPCSSAIAKAHLRARRLLPTACSRRPMVGRCSWTKLRNCRFPFRRSCSVPCRRGKCYPLAQPMPYRSMRSEEHTSELQSLMRISYAVFCLKKKKKQQKKSYKQDNTNNTPATHITEQKYTIK